MYLLKTYSGKSIRFRIKRNEQSVFDFTNKIIESRNKYIRLKYGQPNLHLPYDSQFSNFNILSREGIMTTEECQQKIEELNRLFNQTSPVRVFSEYSNN